MQLQEHLQRPDAHHGLLSGKIGLFSELKTRTATPCSCIICTPRALVLGGRRGDHSETDLVLTPWGDTESLANTCLTIYW